MIAIFYVNCKLVLMPLCFDYSFFNYMKIFLLAILSLSFAHCLRAQEPAVIMGKIVDNNDRPLPYATIRLKNISIGMVSNQNGDFRMPLRPHFLQDTLIVSYIGYNMQKLPVAKLLSEGNNIIVLKEAATIMGELEFHGKSKGRMTAKKIVAAAINSIYVNYPMNPFSYVAYYRDYQIKENNYTNLSEAIVRILDNGFDTNDETDTKIELMQFRLNTTFPIDTLSARPYDNVERKFIPKATLDPFGGNELAILRVHDALRNFSVYSYSFVNTLSEDYIRNHNFRLSKTVNHNSVELYEIKYKSTPSTGSGFHFSEGVIYIEKQNYKIHKMEYSMYDMKDGNKLIYNIKVEYNENDGKMYLNYISFNNEFKMRNPDDFRVLDTRIMSNVCCFSVLFSHPPDSLTAINKDNYAFTILGKKIELDKVEFSPVGKGKEVIATIKSPHEHGYFADAKLAKEITADYINIKDTRGRTVNEPTYIEATQYREIFVQKIESQPSSPETVTGMDRYTPLIRAQVTTNMQNFDDYWMNTPLKKEIE